MGDYDHPSERVEAERIFNLEINKLAGELGLTSNDILIDLSNKITNIKLYNESFHKMNEEYKEVE